MSWWAPDDDSRHTDRNRALNEALEAGGMAAYSALAKRHAAEDAAANDALDKQMAALGWSFQ